MRVLFISTFYPPYAIGGWEQLVQEFVEEMQVRGHATHVLTSRHGLIQPESEPGIDRRLTLEADLFAYRPASLLTYRRRLHENLAVVRETIARFQPDVVFVNIMWNLSPGIAWQAEALCPGRVIYYMADHWTYSDTPHVTYWRDPAQPGLRQLAKRLLAPLALRWIERHNARFQLEFARVLCVSQAIRDNLHHYTNINPDNVRVIYNGIDLERFQPRPPAGSGRYTPLKLVYAGSLIWHKGVHTAVEALARLARQHDPLPVHLTIVGGGHPAYERQLRELAAREGLQQAVTFLGRVDRDEMPALLAQFDALVFPSTWAEPLARTMQEAMAVGLAVIGTTTGGSKEALIPGETGLAFPPEDAAALADQIWTLHTDRALLARLVANARRLAVERFDLRRTLDEVAAELEAMAEREATAVPDGPTT